METKEMLSKIKALSTEGEIKSITDYENVWLATQIMAQAGTINALYRGICALAKQEALEKWDEPTSLQHLAELHTVFDGVARVTLGFNAKKVSQKQEQARALVDATNALLELKKDTTVAATKAKAGSVIKKLADAIITTCYTLVEENKEN